jgi:hypothetical protein
VSLTVLQLASVVADMEEFFVHERHVLEDFRDRAEPGGSFEDGLLLGASALQGIFEVERDIDLALRRLEDALRPLDLHHSISSMRRRELFSARGSDSFADSIEESFALLQWRGREMRALRERLLGLDDEAYGKSIDDELHQRLDRDLRGLLSEEDV